MRDNLRVQIKQLDGVNWLPVSLKDLQGKSALSFIAGSEIPVVAAVYDNDTPAMFISNSETEVNKYKAKAPSFFASDLQELVSGEMVGSAFVTACETVFGDCKYVELSLKKPQPEKPKNSLYKPNVSKPVYPQFEENQMDLI